jgi:saccharopine dehydrogenase-like NADP-dependent oxidoreductase
MPFLEWLQSTLFVLDLLISACKCYAFLQDLPCIVADSEDQASVDAMVMHANVLMSLAGPYAKHSPPLVDACVRLGTHYCDLTGEPHTAILLGGVCLTGLLGEVCLQVSSLTKSTTQKY